MSARRRFIAIAIAGTILVFIAYAYANNAQSQIEGLNTMLIDSKITEDKLHKEFKALNDLNSLLKGELERARSEYSFLSISYLKAIESNEDLAVDNELLKEHNNNLSYQVNNLVDSIEDYRQEIQDSIEWFQRNSEISDIPNEKRIKNNLRGKCFTVGDDICQVKLGCLYLVNSRLNFEYKQDISTSGKDDKLQSLYEFVHNWGGDCEDYALFYKAELNYILEQCEGKQLEYEAWTDGSEDYFLDMNKEWYLENAQAINVKERFPAIVCGNLLDPVTGSINGHCSIAFTDEKMLDRTHISYLYDSPIIEPQTGKFEATIGKEVGLGGTDHDQEIFVIITNDDLFLYDKQEDGWMSYLHFDSLLQKIDKELQDLDIE